MKVIPQILLAIGLFCPLLPAQEGGQPEAVRIQWEPLKIAQSHFPRNIGLMDAERDDYANNLAATAIVHLRAHKADRASSDLARKMMALALHLSPRNKQAVVLNFQLGRGLVPDPPATDYRPKTLALLLMNRAKLLEKQEGESNVELSGYLLSLAADLDPESEDAIYLSELHRINHGEVNWPKLLTNKE